MIRLPQWIAIWLVIAAYFFILIGLAVSASGASIPAHQLKGQIVIDDDYGGSVSTYVNWYKRIAIAGVPVRFRGMCISACTLGLALPREQICAEPTTTFGFHLASVDGVADPDATLAIMLRYYPPQVQAWLANKKLTLEHVVYMTAREAVTLGVMPWCSENVGV